MDNFFESLKFNYSKETGQISSVKVVFSDLTQESILISKDFINEIRKYVPVINENDKELFYIIARAIRLKSENNKGSSGRVHKYDFSSKHDPFHERFISKLMQLSKYVPLENIVNYFGEDAKVDDLDVFLNRKDIYSLTLFIRDGIDDPDDDIDDDFY